MVLSKSCKYCKEAESSKSQEFLDLMEKHQDSCKSNFFGSSPAMEVEGVSIIGGGGVKPVFTELSKLELLEKCVLGATQNLKRLSCLLSAPVKLHLRW